MGLRNIGPGVRESVYMQGPITIASMSPMTFEADLEIPAGMVSKEIEVVMKQTVTGTQGGSAITNSQLINQFKISQGRNNVRFDSGSLVDACVASALIRTPYPMEIQPAEQYTDTAIAAGGTAYTSRYKIVEGLGTGKVHFRLDTVSPTTLYAAWTTPTNCSVSVQFIIHCVEKYKSETFTLAAERINAITKYDLQDIAGLVLIGAATMVGVNVNGAPKSYSAAEMAEIEAQVTERFPSALSKYGQMYMFGKHLNISLTASSALTATAVVIRDSAEA